jgi:conjugal transfer ATP-binding protein TraC
MADGNTPFGSLGAAVSRLLARQGRAWFGDDVLPPDAPRMSVPGATLAALLPWRYYASEPGVFVQDRSFGIVLFVSPLVGGDEATQRILTELFNESLPEQAKVQVIQWASPRIGPVIDRWAAFRAARGGVQAELARQRRELFRAGAWRSLSPAAPFLLRDFQVLVSIEVTGGDDDKLLASLAATRDRFVQTFRTIHAAVRALEPADLIALMSDLLNPTSSVLRAEPSYDPARPIADQVVRWDTRVTVHRHRLLFSTANAGDGLGADAVARDLDGRAESFEVRGLSVRQFPDHCSQALMAKAIGDLFNDQLRLPCPVVTSLCFAVMSGERTTADTEFKRMRTQQGKDSGVARLFPGMRKAAEDWEMVAEDVSEGARLCFMGLFVLVICGDGEGERCERAVSALFRNARFSLERHDHVHMPTLMACLPLGIGGGLADELRAHRRMRRMPTSVAARLAPLQGEDRGGPLPHLLVAGRRGQVGYWSPFENDGNGNHNVAVVGSSGSGKSVFMQETATSLLGGGAEVVVVDNGRSFKNSCLLLGGAWIRFSLEAGLCLNPFGMVDHDLAREDEEYAAEARTNLKLLVIQMARGARGATDEEAGVVEKAVNDVFDAHGPQGSIDRVAEALRDPAFGERGRNLELSIAAFTSAGNFGALFNGPASLEITNPYTVFELEDLEAKPELRAVVVLQILSLVRERMRRGGRQLKKALIIDEAWSLLGDGAAGKFIEGFARRCRKEGGALITGTQSLEDFYSTAGARACIENSDWNVILRLKPEALDQFKKADRLNVDQGMMELLKSLRMDPGVYAEMLIRGPGARFLARLALDPFSATLYSTKPEVYAAIEQLVGQGVALHEAVRRVAAKDNPPLLLEEQLKAEVQRILALDAGAMSVLRGYAAIDPRRRRQVVEVVRRLVETEANP